jgi:Zn-dependent oligopeptidase
MKNSSLYQNIQKAIHTEACVDYAFLSQKEVIQDYENILKYFLEQAKKSFAIILKTPKEKQSFTSIVKAFLSHDKDLSLLFGFFTNYHHTCGSGITRKIIENFQPKLVDWNNTVNMHYDFYLLLKNIEQELKTEKILKNEQLRSVQLIIEDMEHNGVHLEGETKNQLEGMNTKLAALSEKFSLHVIDSKKEFFYHFDNDDSLKEMPESALLSAQREAKNRKLAGYVFTLSPPSFMALMKYCSDSQIRKIFYEKSNGVASSGEYDNRPLVLEILQLRYKKAKILGCKNYSEYVMKTRMAKSTQEVQEVLSSFVIKSRKKAGRDMNELKESASIEVLEAWDVSYFSEKLMKQKFHLDQELIKQYFALDTVFEGLFGIVEKLYGVTLKKVICKSYHQDVLCFEVYQGKEVLAYYILDMYARTEKQPGAWCDLLRSPIDKEGVKQQIPIVLNVGNFSQPVKKTDPILLNHVEVQTLFHEFGHALHVMLSKVSYENLNGFHVEWDFVELPSQILENWTWHPEALSTFAKHYQTGEVLSKDLVNKLLESRKFMSGLRMLRQSEFGFLDLSLHDSQVPKNIKELDEKCLKIAQKYSLFEKSENYKMYCSFSHIFAGGYAAGYYSYLWAEILEAEAFSVFKKEGVLSPLVGSRFKNSILSAGATKSAKDLFKDFLGRAPATKALEDKYGI